MLIDNAAILSERMWMVVMKEALTYLLADLTPSPLQDLNFSLLVRKFYIDIVRDRDGHEWRMTKHLLHSIRKKTLDIRVVFLAPNDTLECPLECEYHDLSCEYSWLE